MQLRAKTLSELRSRLDDSYFTAESFSVKNIQNGSPFLEVIFSPSPKFVFKLYEGEGGQILAAESPGEFFESAEEKIYKNIDSALRSVASWTRRIREEYVHSDASRNEVDDFLERLRANIFKEEEGEDPSTEYSASEINGLRESLDKLKELIAEQAEKLNANTAQIIDFEKEIERIKADLLTMPKGVWKKVAGNKLLKSVKGFMGTPEGRKLIADGLKKMIGID